MKLKNLAIAPWSPVARRHWECVC